MRCTICGSLSSVNIKINDIMWTIGEQNICKTCFDLWASEDVIGLDKRVRKKLGCK